MPKIRGPIRRMVIARACGMLPRSGLADRAFHVELDEPGQLDGVLHRQRLDVIGSMKPFTIIAVACCSVSPRLIR